MPRAYSDPGTFYVYILLDTTRPGEYDYGNNLRFKFEPFYVGKGKGSRCQHHFLPANLRKESKKNKRILSIKRKTGELPKVVIKKKNVDEVTAFLLEYKAIGLIGRKDLKQGPLLNRSAGGAGSSGRTDSPEVCARRAASIRNAIKMLPASAKRDQLARAAATRACWSDAEWDSFYTLCRESNRSHETSVRKKMSKSGKARVANMTGKEKLAHGKRMSKAVTEMHASLTAEERSARIKKAHLSRDNVAIGKKIARSTVLAHARMSDKDKQAKAEKIRQSLLNRPPEVMQRLAAGNAMRAALRRSGRDVQDSKWRPKLDQLIASTPWDGRPVMMRRFTVLVEQLLGL